MANINVKLAAVRSKTEDAGNDLNKTAVLSFSVDCSPNTTVDELLDFMDGHAEFSVNCIHGNDGSFEVAIESPWDKWSEASERAFGLLQWFTNIKVEAVELKKKKTKASVE